MSVEEHGLPKHVVCPHFSRYLLRDHSINLRKCTPGLRGSKITCKGGFFFTPPKWPGFPHLPGVPHFHVNRPEDFL